MMLTLNCQGATIKVGQIENYTANQLPPHFLPLLPHYTHASRLNQWIAARLLLEQVSGKKITDVKVSEQGKPFFANGGGYFSISHTMQVAAVIWHPTKQVGIDIEHIRPQILKIKHKFLSEPELAMIYPIDNLQLLTACWCAKEALYKLYGLKQLQFNKDIILSHLQINPPDNTPLAAGLHATINKGSYKVNTHVIIYTISENTVLAAVVLT